MCVQPCVGLCYPSFLEGAIQACTCRALRPPEPEHRRAVDLCFIKSWAAVGPCFLSAEDSDGCQTASDVPEEPESEAGGYQPAPQLVCLSAPDFLHHLCVICILVLQQRVCQSELTTVHVLQALYDMRAGGSRTLGRGVSLLLIEHPSMPVYSLFPSFISWCRSKGIRSNMSVNFLSRLDTKDRKTDA